MVFTRAMQTRSEYWTSYWAKSEEATQLSPAQAFRRRLILSALQVGLARVCSTFEIERLSGAGFPFFNLYRLMAIARGKRLIGDVQGESGPSPLARAVLRMFSVLFRLNGTTALGWQCFAVARAA